MKVQITFPSAKVKEFPSGITAREILQDEEFQAPRQSAQGKTQDRPGAASASDRPIVGALVNNDVVSLTYRIEINSRVEPILLNTREGATIYRRSLSFLLAIASHQLFPDRRLVIGHSLGNGFFYHFDGRQEIPAGELERLREKMVELVEAGMPIRRQVISYQEAVSYFAGHRNTDTALLLKNRNDPKIPVYTCGEFMDLAHAPLAPNTALLKTFEIMNHPPGFLLRYPPWDSPETLAVFEDNPILFSIYGEYKNWGKILGVSCVGHLNDLIQQRQVRQFIQVAEALHNKKIAEIADRINERRDLVKVVLIAGPSSSGKTTFAKKLCIQLRVLGRNPVPISLDDYFLPREQTPRDEQGNYDFEALEAIDVELLNRHLVALLGDQEVTLPRFDFHTGTRKAQGTALKLPRRAIIILEGIHGLNDRLTPLIEGALKYKIYVSALAQLNLDDHNRISTTDNRLIRRIVRDHQFRGHSALDTLAMWPSVRLGEDRNIFPFQNSANSAFNSALDYELAVLKVYAESLLRSVKPDQKYFHEARRLLSFLGNFTPLPANWVPEDSILREFIGESAFKY